MKHKRLKAGSRIQRENKTGFGLVYRRRGGGGSKSFTRSSRLLPNIYLLAHWETGWLILIQQKSSLVFLVAHSCRFRPTSRIWRVRHEHSLWWFVPFHKLRLVKIQTNVWCQLSVHCLVLNSEQTQYNNQLSTLAGIWKFQSRFKLFHLCSYEHEGSSLSQKSVNLFM